MTEFEKDLANLLNRYSQENGSDTPDFILAKYLNACLTAWNHAVLEREIWSNSPCSRVVDALVAERERMTALEKKCIDLCGALFSTGIHAAEVEMELDKLRAEIERLLEKK